MKNQKGFTHVEVLVVIVVLAMVGFAFYRVNNNQTLNSNQSNDSSELLTEEIEGIKPISELEQLVADAQSGQSISSVKLENEDGATVYEVLLSNGNLLIVDAFTGELLSQTTVEIDDGDEVEAVNWSSIKISFADAKRIAIERYGESQIEDIELEVEDGLLVYSVDFTDDTRVDVNAETGEIERFKTDDVDERSRTSESDDDDDRDDVDDNGQQSDHDDDDHADEDHDHDDDEEDDDDDDRDDDDRDNSGSGNSDDRS